MIAEIVVPRNVTAITRVDARVMLEKPPMSQIYSADIMRPGMTMRSIALKGALVLGSTSATASGSILSKAAEKITLVDDRKIVPAQPKNQRLIATRITI